MLIIFCLILIVLTSIVVSTTIHGGAFLAIAGRDSVVLATDSRFSSLNPTLLGTHPRLLFRVGSKTIVGCFGLEAHIRVLIDQLRIKLEGIRDSELDSSNIAKLISNLMYKMPLQLSPLVVGTDRNKKPFICSMDGIGACTISDNYGVVGTATSGLYTLCESLYQQDLSANECVGLAEKCMKLALDRDVLSGSDIRIVTLFTDGNTYVKDVAVSKG